MREGDLISSFRMSHHIHEHIYSNGNPLSFPHPRIGYLEQGTAEFLYHGKTIRAKAGDLIYIAPGTRYYSIWRGEPEVRFYSVSFSFAMSRSFSGYRFQIVPDWPAERFHRMFAAYERENLFPAVAELYLLLAELYPNMRKETLPAEDSPVAPAIAYIESHCRENLTVAELAKLCKCSESHLYYQFREAVGVSPIAYRHNIVVQLALEQLRNTDKTIEEISDELGFSSPNYFRKVFRKVTRQSPRDFRRKG